jgi:hypothetical protein
MSFSTEPLVVCAASGFATRCLNDSGEHLRWAHRPKAYVPLPANLTVKPENPLLARKSSLKFLFYGNAPYSIRTSGGAGGN